MNTRRLVVVGGLSLALVMALGAGILVGSLAGGSVFAQGPDQAAPSFGRGMMGHWLTGTRTFSGTMPYGGMMGGRGMMGGVAPAQPNSGAAPQAGGLGMMGGVRGLGYNEVMLPSLAKALGLTVDQLQAELKAGKTVADLAKAKGIALDKLAADMLAAHKEYLARLVSEGKITQQMADWMTQRMEQVENHPCLTGEVTPGAGQTQGFTGGRGGMMGGRGMMGRFGTQGSSD